MITKRRKLAWLMWIIMIMTYMLNTFHAVSMGAIRQNFMQEFQMSDSQYVLLTNAFSYTYMIMQIPAGILLDRLGARKIACIGNSCAAAGGLIFAFASHYAMLFVGRSMIGLGCSVCFLSVLKICSEWFEDKLFCTMSGVTCFVGMIGAMAAQTPLAALNSMMSWRHIFCGIAILTMIVVGMIFLFVKDKPSELGLPDICQKQERNNFSVVQAVISVLKNKRTWPPFISYGCFYGSYLLISGLYGTSMIREYYQVDDIKASSLITFAVLGCAVGSVVVDILADYFHSRRFAQFYIGILYMFSWMALGYCMGRTSLTAIYPIMFLLGFLSCAYSVCWSCVKECNHPDYVGISTSIANMGGYLGSILVPTIIGNIYAAGVKTGGELVGYQYIIIGAVIVNMIGIISAWLVKETGGRNIYGE